MMCNQIPAALVLLVRDLHGVHIASFCLGCIAQGEDEMQMWFQEDDWKGNWYHAIAHYGAGQRH